MLKSRRNDELISTKSFAIVTNMEYTSFGLLFALLQSSSGTSELPIVNLCKGEEATATIVNLNMDTTAIAGSTGLCHCTVEFHVPSAFTMSFNDITSPNCGTKILLNDGSINTTCHDGKIPSVSHSKYYNINDGITIQARANVSQSEEPMSGGIQMKTNDSANFTLECLETTITRSPTTPTVTTSTVTTTHTTTITTTALQTFTYGSSPSTSTAVWTTASSFTSTHSTTAGGSNMISTQSNETLKDTSNFPVALTAGCATGGVILVGLIIVAIIIWRKRKYPRNLKKHDPTSIQKGDRRSMDDEYLSMENDLYCSSDDLPMPSENTTCDRTDVESEEKKKQVVSPNGDIYTIVDKPKNISSPPKSKLNHRTAPSGDVYTFVDKLR